MIILKSRIWYKIIIGMLSICIILLLNVIYKLNTYSKTMEERYNSQRQKVQILEQEAIISTQEIESLKKEVEEMSEEEIKINEFQQKEQNLQNIEDKEKRFIAYKKLLKEYSQWIDPPESIEDEYSSDEIYLLQRAVETEVHGGSFEAKVNVACVILNRVSSRKFPDNLTDVITFANQFAYKRTRITEETQLAVECAFMMQDVTNGALYFHSNPKTDYFNGAKFIFKDDVGHCFYK